MFRDEWDRKAHDIICIIKYGGRGGSVRTPDMHRVGDILRGGPPVMFAPPKPPAPPMFAFAPPIRKGE